MHNGAQSLAMTSVTLRLTPDDRDRLEALRLKVGSSTSALLVATFEVYRAFMKGPMHEAAAGASQLHHVFWEVARSADAIGLSRAPDRLKLELVRISVRVDDSLHAYVKAACQANGATITGFVRSVVTPWPELLTSEARHLRRDAWRRIVHHARERRPPQTPMRW